MGDLTKNISRSELGCKCGCGFNTMDWETIEVVQQACDDFQIILGVEKVKLTINSAARCFAHNSACGGSTKSQHRYGRAVDIVIDRVAPRNLFNYFNDQYPDRLGLGEYETFTHVDTRPGKARW